MPRTTIKHKALNDSKHKRHDTNLF